MRTASLSRERLDELVARFSTARIAVIGDFFLDRYLDVDPSLEEVSVETGKPAHQVVNVRCHPGAAGTVVANLAALGAGQIHAVGMTGDDGEGFELRNALAEIGCSTTHLHAVPDRYTPTYLKPRDNNRPGLGSEHSRYDTKNRTPLSHNVVQQIANSLTSLIDEVDAVIIIDQVDAVDCGVVTSLIRDSIQELAASHQEIVFWADSRRRIRDFSNVIIKPNQFEAVGIDDPLPGDTVELDELERAGRTLRSRTGSPLFITRGGEGMLVSDPQWTVVPAVPVVGEMDPTGAGDSVTAGCVLALCACAELPEAAVVGNLVASITVKQLATTGTAKPEELALALDAWQTGL